MSKILQYLAHRINTDKGKWSFIKNAEDKFKLMDAANLEMTLFIEDLEKALNDGSIIEFADTIGCKPHQVNAREIIQVKAALKILGKYEKGDYERMAREVCE